MALKQRTVYRTANTQPTLLGIPRMQAIALFSATAYIGQFLHSFWLWLALMTVVFIGAKLLFRRDPRMIEALWRFARAKHVYDPHLHKPFEVTIRNSR